MRVSLIFLILGFNPLTISAQPGSHPSLLITSETLDQMVSAVETLPLWAKTVEEFVQKVDIVISSPMDVPVPADPAGGYTHSQHKINGKAIRDAGIAYLVTSQERYADYVKELLLSYAAIYPQLGEHPVKKSYAPGKLFWQQLNEAVWLVDAIQGYDAIFDQLSKKERKVIEKDLLLPFANFLSIENPRVFNRIHNHGVWAVAAVGMTGIATGNQELVLRALYGIGEDGSPNRNDVSLETLNQLNSGFFHQTTSLFSPDGYYTEGPFYQRYAMTPFLLFAQSLDHNYPALSMMEFGDGLFIKAVHTLVDLSDSKGRYYPINDNLKGMSLYSPGSTEALAFLYSKSQQRGLLSILADSESFSINGNTLKVISDLSKDLQVPLVRKSKLISDGASGDEGGIALLRDSDDEFSAVIKYASHGLSHGHFDRLNIFLYQGANEVLTDYGSVRFVNVKAKEGGRYLPENDSYAKQTVAHNTVVIDGESHFQGSYKAAQQTHSELVYSEIDNPDEQFVCVRENSAYNGVVFTRIVGMLKDDSFHEPILLDLFHVEAENEATTFDLPYHFNGTVLKADFPYEPDINKLSPLGEANGYEHLWKLASGKSQKGQIQFSWLENTKIYTLTSVVSDKAELFITRLGATDPNFSLRPEPAIIIREPGNRKHLFVSLLETHGDQNESTEMVSNQEPTIASLKAHVVKEGYVAVEFTSWKNSYLLISTLLEGQENQTHSLDIQSRNYSWTGNYTIIKTEL